MPPATPIQAPIAAAPQECRTARENAGTASGPADLSAVFVPSIVDPMKSRVSLTLFRTQPPTLCMAVPLSIRYGALVMA
jgi:hypothetical protein